MGFRAFGDFAMTLRQFEALQPHTRTEMALLVQERLREEGDGRQLSPEIADWADLQHSYKIPAGATDYYPEGGAL